MQLYQLEFTTWENDGDDYATIGKILTTVEDVNFYRTLADKFISCHSYGKAGGFGNEEVSEETLQEVVQEHMEDHPNISEKIHQEWLKAIEQEGVYDKLCAEILSDPVQYDYGFCRVMERVHESTLESGDWIKVNGRDVVFVTYENDLVHYRMAVNPKNESGQLDIFRVEWQKGECQLEKIENLGRSDEISKQVAKLG